MNIPKIGQTIAQKAQKVADEVPVLANKTKNFVADHPKVTAAITGGAGLLGGFSLGVGVGKNIDKKA